MLLLFKYVTKFFILIWNFPCYPAWFVLSFTHSVSKSRALILFLVWIEKTPNFQCGLRLLDVSMQCTSQNPTAPCFLQHSFFYFNSLLCTWLMIFRDRRLLVGCRSHRLMKKLGVLLSELPSPQCGRVSQRLLNDWTLLHSASLMDGKQGRPLFHPDSLTRLIY